MKKKRLHDTFYLNEDRRNKPKECFKIASKIIEEHIIYNDLFGLKVLDIGAATGDFIWHLKNNNLIKGRVSKIYGVDIRKDLLNLLKDRMPDVNISKLDISSEIDTKKFLEKIKTKFEITFMSGVNAIFDNCDWINNVSNLTSNNGFTIIFGPFNNSDFDVIVGIRESGSEIIQSGWNTLSIKTLKQAINKLDRKVEIKVDEFEMPFDIVENKNDPLRAYTLNTKEYGRIQVNGVSLLRPQKFIILNWD